MCRNRGGVAFPYRKAARQLQTVADPPRDLHPIRQRLNVVATCRKRDSKPEITIRRVTDSFTHIAGRTYAGHVPSSGS